MPGPAEPQDDFPLEASVPEGAAPLESILCTEELHRRPWRPPDYDKENRALMALVTAMVDSRVQYSSNLGRDDSGRYPVRFLGL